MGFGFNLGMVFIIIPLTIGLIVIGSISKSKLPFYILGLIWAGIALIVTASLVIRKISDPVVLEKADFYGEYVIDRRYFSGINADWQYDHIRFEITEEDSIFVHLTDKEKILKTIPGTIETLDQYISARLRIHLQEPGHHIFTEDPTIYRSAFGFRLVLRSPQYHNVFFRKGKWKPIPDPAY